MSTCLVLLRVLSWTCWSIWKHLFILYMCSCVLDCNLLCYIIVIIIILVNKIIYFSVKLKNLKEFYFIFCSLLFYTDWKYLVCLLPFDSNMLQEFCCFSVALLAVWRFVEASQAMMVLGGNRIAWLLSIVYCFTFSFFLTRIMFCCHRKGVECAIPHTAIYAGQELWHFIFCLRDL